MKLTDEAIDKIMADADLELAEPYNSRGSYRKGDWLLTRCRRCGVVAHYRLAYILEKTELGEPVCRACFWPGWYDDCHKTRAEVIQKHLDEGYDLDFLLDSGFAPRRHALEWPQAEKLADAHGYRLIGMIHGTREGDDLMVVRCRACGRQSVERPGDVEFGCTCKGKGLGDPNPYPADRALPAKAQSNA